MILVTINLEAKLKKFLQLIDPEDPAGKYFSDLAICPVNLASIKTFAKL